MEILEDLPQSLVEVAEEIGLVNALALAAIYGGRELRVLRQFPPTHLVVVLLGRETADQLSARFGGGTLDLAKGEVLRREERDAAICEDRPTTKVADLARKYRLTERAVWGILRRRKRRREPPKSEQLQLFERG